MLCAVGCSGVCTVGSCSFLACVHLLFDKETYFVVPFVLTLLSLCVFCSWCFFSQEFNDFVVRCLEKKPEERPTSRALLRVSCLLVLVSDTVLEATQRNIVCTRTSRCLYWGRCDVTPATRERTPLLPVSTRSIPFNFRCCCCFYFTLTHCRNLVRGRKTN